MCAAWVSPLHGAARSRRAGPSGLSRAFSRSRRRRQPRRWRFPRAQFWAFRARRRARGPASVAAPGPPPWL
eukprot:4986689-Lingulodinium_polyedra.AAC.1